MTRINGWDHCQIWQASNDEELVMFLSKSHRCIACGVCMWGGGIENHMFQYLRTSNQKKLLAIWLGVYTVGCVNSLKVKFFRHVAMNRHIKSVRFTTKIRKTRNIRPCFSNSGDNTAVSQLCNFSYKTTLLPPKQFSCWTYIYARILNWVAFIVLPSSYARILSWVAFIVLPSSLPAQITSLFSSCARGL